MIPEMNYPVTPYGYPPRPPEHPRASTALILGILGVSLCQVIAPFAWVIGRRTVTEIDASGGTLGGRNNAQAGLILGIAGTALLVFALVIVISAVLVTVISGSATSSGY